MKRLLYIGIAAIFISCGVDDINYDNPLDPENPAYEAPSTVISNPLQGITYDEHSLVAEWQGNKEGMTYRTKLDDNNWSHQLGDETWYPYEFMPLEYLDEGTHAFLVQGRYVSGDLEPQPDSVAFTIDAVTGPALRIYRMYNTAAVNDQLALEIYAEEVSSIAGAEITINFDPSKVRVDGWEIGPFMETAGVDPLAFTEINNTSGETTLNIGVMGVFPDDVSGTGIIASLDITLLSVGETQLTFDNQTTLRYDDNAAVSNVELVRTIILVE